MIEVSALGNSSTAPRQGATPNVAAKNNSGNAATGSAAEGQVLTNGQSTPSLGAGAYISPVVRYDQLARMAVLYFRDAVTGDTEDQIPTKAVVDRYRRTVLDNFNGGGLAEDGAAGAQGGATTGNAVTGNTVTGRDAASAPSGGSGPTSPAVTSATTGGGLGAGGAAALGSGATFSITV